jgi:hypothetical protein
MLYGDGLNGHNPPILQHGIIYTELLFSLMHKPLIWDNLGQEHYVFGITLLEDIYI